ncbi:NAD-dependent epimerase/dehydratase family protein [Streptomyces sp. 130]|uniref:SDR family oxidoreductase n=1 Tax=Streptomyces sp. 130 TaxID=2591006 RepID=UPI00117F251D|nr:NAD(P)H-binding protein [Streptomyces sp. 130]TRV78503.1 NAD-dependent epimerase/dehydratase family protein [Streptomyces sp. 130]
MKIAIVGATGTAGRAATFAAQQAGHEVLALSRATGVDLHTGAGLVEGIRGADVVIDTSNAFPATGDADLVATFADATDRLIAVCKQVGVQRLVHLSICNIDDPVFDQFDYYLAKRAQEQALNKTDLPHTIIRSAQWMEFALNPGAVTQTETEVRVEDWLIQPVAVTTVAQVLIEAATADSRDRQVAGAEQVRLPDLARALLEATGDARPVTAAPPSLPALAEGVLLAPPGAELLGPSVNEWVGSQQNPA